MPSNELDANVRTCVSCKKCYSAKTQFCSDCFVELVNIDFVPFIIDSRYQLERLINQGAMGVVFAAHDRERGEMVAIKVIRSSAMADPRAQDRFRREVDFATKLKHPNLAAIFGHGALSDASSYVVSEFIEGPTLRDVMKAEDKIPIARAVSILSGVADGLNAAHQAGIVHRDIKPGSVVLISEDSPNGEVKVKIVDFSFSRVAIGHRYIPGTTRSLQGRGILPLSVSYVSPEQFRGEEVDLRTDIYSLGVVGYEMLGGKAPFNARKTGDFATKLLTERPPSLRQLNPEVNVLLQAEIMRALEKEPRQRHQSAAEFKRAITSAQQLGLRIVE